MDGGECKVNISLVVDYLSERVVTVIRFPMTNGDQVWSFCPDEATRQTE